MAGKKRVEALPEAVIEQDELLEDQVEGLDEEELDEEEGYSEDELIGPDGKQLLFPGGPSVDAIEEWKSRYGEIYLTEFEEDVFIWRSLTRKEYKEIMKIANADNFYKEERICDKVVIWPEGYNFLKMGQGKAGIPTLIAELVMEKSGFQAKTGALRL